MKRILIVNDGFPPETWGGANTVASLHAEALVRLGYEVKVFTTTQSKNTKTGWSDYRGVKVGTFYTSYSPRWAAYKSLYNPQILAHFRRELKSFKPDIVHFHNIHNYVSYHAISLAKKSGARVFLTTHDVMSFAYRKLHNFIDYSDTKIPEQFNYRVPWQVNLRDARFRFNPFRSLLVRYYLRKVDKIFAVSAALKQALADNGIGGNVEVVHNGVDVPMFQNDFDKDKLRRELGLRDGKVILFVGRFTKDKGRDVCINILAQIVKTLPEAKLLVVGHDQASEKDKIVYVGKAAYDQIYKYYAISNCVIVPSVIFDSFPTVNLEAAASAKPVVATCFGGSREAVLDGVTGYIVNPIDTESVALKIIKILSDKAASDEMGRAALNRVSKEFSVERQMADYQKYYLGRSFGTAM